MEDETKGEDLLSNLPNSLLHHILSFLPTHLVVQTCVLSKKWRYMWTQVPTLCFHELLMIHSKNHKHINFINFVEHTIHFLNTPVLYKFHLILDGFHTSAFNKHRLESVISVVLKQRKVQKLILHIDAVFSIVFPQSIFSSKSLTKMKLYGLHSTLEFPASVIFPNLKQLHLIYLRISCVEGVRRVSFDCPVLEEVLFVDCEWYDIASMEMFAPNLGRMILEDLRTEYNNNCELDFHAENLYFLDVFSCLKYKLSFHNLRALYDANVDIGSKKNNNNDRDRVSKLMQEIHNVKKLSLSYSTIRRLSSMKDLLAFSNLKNLVIWKSRFLNGESLKELFFSLLHIESISLMNGLDKYSDGGYEWSHEVIPQKNLMFLKSFEIKKFYGNETEVSLVEFLLSTARAIEKITIVSSSKLCGDPKKQLEVTKRLLNCRRESIGGVIDFS